MVDPGVGSPRRALAAEAGDYRFVAPDNGVLTMVLDEVPPGRVVELSERRYARPAISRTFEGRDRFAPAAAWLATGLELAALGRPPGPCIRLEIPRPSVTGQAIDGEVVRVDRFGNLVTNIDRKTFDRLSGDGAGRRARRLPRDRADRVDLRRRAPGELCALFGSSDHLEIAARGTSAADASARAAGTAVHVGRRCVIAFPARPSPIDAPTGR